MEQPHQGAFRTGDRVAGKCIFTDNEWSDQLGVHFYYVRWLRSSPHHLVQYIGSSVQERVDEVRLIERVQE